MLARVPAFEVAQYLILVLNLAYYAASHICTFMGLGVEKGQRYLYEVFLQSGVPMVSRDFSSVLGRFNLKYLNKDFRLLDYRQLLAACLIAKTGSSFDDEDEELVSKHESFGHTMKTGRAHYAVELVGHSTTTSPDAVAQWQKVSTNWHWFTGLSYPSNRSCEARILHTVFFFLS
jgi:hypothetical protein